MYTFRLVYSVFFQPVILQFVLRLGKPRYALGF